MASGPKALPKMMLGFVVRRCVAAVGHQPSAEEFAAWANQQHDGNRRFTLFGRPITASEARLILRHPGRPVTARGAAPHESMPAEGEAPAKKVISFVVAAARLKARTK
jgi:hypothetical protein